MEFVHAFTNIHDGLLELLFKMYIQCGP